VISTDIVSGDAGSLEANDPQGNRQVCRALIRFVHRPARRGISRKPQHGAKPFSVFVPPHHGIGTQEGQAWPDQEIIRRQAFL
jgi:hypothetical protein